ncbi:MAG: GNAT family N-acetyltransferase [Acidimicrobiales bacterium]
MEEASRPATPDDVGTLTALLSAAVDELTPTKGGDVWARREARAQPAEDSFRRLITDADHLVVVGTIDDVAVGYAAVETEVLRDGGELARLDDVFVLPDARGVGVGEVMIDLVLEWAEQRGCIGIDSIALPGNRATKNFFETHGLVARAIVVHRRFGR